MKVPDGLALCPILVGRDQDLAAVEASFEAARGGRGTVVFITGEAGIGKSRLARESHARAEALGMTVLTGRAVERESHVPFRPLGEALLSALRTSGPPDAPELRPVQGALGRLVPEWLGPSTTADVSTVVVSEALLRLLGFMSRRRPVVLALEDLHWSDAESLSVVEYLADNVGDTALCCLATVRSDEPSPALDLARSLAARRAAALRSLSRLSADETSAMARACLGTQDLPSSVREQLQAWTEGVPFFVEELLASWIETRALARHGAGWDVRRLQPTVPVTFGEVVRRRVGRLDRNSVAVLRAAAVLGRRFDWSVLPEIAELTQDQVLAALHRCVASQLVIAESVGGRAMFRFRHALTRDAILSELLPPERLALSTRALEAAERRFPGFPGEWCELGAELAETSGDGDRAARLLLVSGQRALHRGALVTAEETLARARTLSGDPQTIARIEDTLTDVLSLAGRADEVYEVGEELLAWLRRLDVPSTRMVDVHLRVARAAVTATDWPRAANHLEAARAATSPADAVSGARIDAVAAQLAIGEGRLADAVALAETALRTAHELGLPEVACEALEVIGREARLRDPRAAEAAFEEALALAEKQQLGVWRIRALHELATIGLDNMDEADLRRMMQTRTLAEDAGALAITAHVDNNLAILLLFRGDVDQGLQAARRCTEQARRLRLGLLVPTGLVTQAEAHALALRRPQMEALLAEAFELAGDDPDVGAGAWGECRAWLSLLTEDRVKARAELAQAIRFARRTPTAWPCRSIWALLSAVDDERGPQAVTEVAALETALLRPGRFLLNFARAVLLGRAGRHQQALELFESADRDGSGLEWSRQVGRRLVAEAALRDGWGKPVAWLQEASSAFDANGYPRPASACRSLLRLAGVRVARRGRGSAVVPPPLRELGVTSREMDVLVLVGEGQSNREIAERLYLSPRTVQNHVDRLLMKTGLDSRVRLVAFAAGLTSPSPS